MYFGKIVRVYQDGLAEELGLKPGDKILEVNQQTLRDIIDFSFAFSEEDVELLVEHENGEQELLAFEKDYDEELGVEFESAVFDGIRNCANQCCFCFVDQIAPHMRSNLSVKDDDYRMSFLYGNFVTLTNMGPADFQRIRQYHLSPLFVSVQTMNPALRAKMLGCQRASAIAEQLDHLQESEVEYHTQVVLCPGLNDGAELERTIREIVARRPYAQSLAIVPVGLTKYRENCCELKMFDQEGAAAVISQVEKWQKLQREKDGRTFIYLSDEFYFLAGKDLPPASYYDGFPQLDNGIGLARNFIEEWEQSICIPAVDYEKPLYLQVVSGTSFAPVLRQMIAGLKLKNLHVRVVPVENRFFGTMVNVSGLLTGQDILAEMKKWQEPCDGVILPESALRTGENVFLDDYTLEQVTSELCLPVKTALTGEDLCKLLTNWNSAAADSLDEAVYMWQSNAAYTKPMRKKGK